MTSGQASLLDSIFSLADAHPRLVLPYTTKRPEMRMIYGPATREEQSAGTGRGQSTRPNSQVEPIIDRVAGTADIADTNPDYERLLVGLFKELALDQNVESNITPFVVHSFTSWMSRFLFEPMRVVSLTRDTIVRGHFFGDEPRQRMVLIANTVSAVSKSTDYELTYFATLYAKLVNGVRETRARGELTRDEAIDAMESCHELISITCKVGPLADSLKLMDLYAPIFRRGCPESCDELVNLPQRLTAFEMNLKYFATLDVLQGTLTHRPMFFRYDLTFLSPLHEELLDLDEGPGLRWLHGVPDRLIYVLAKMNTLFEDHGSCVASEKIQELEGDIEACKPVVYSSTEDDLPLKVGRIVVQESWRLAAYVYLYMASRGLCGADSHDARVVKVHKRFMKLLGTVKPRRNPDAFLMYPMILLGVAASTSEDRSTLLARPWGVSECTKSGTLGNDVVRIVNDIWARTEERPAVWSDLRVACLRVTGI
ncbi:unnamed protein product [Rhizoctonia solani]|uniref:Fungal-specific transcription factor domain protein n=1 Tax=Rhizoctonia solani TaxID=456999 RepID=A0A8H3AGP7_9AGAM|nr:unnamed protein product [Rhizoctonia solani]